MKELNMKFRFEVEETPESVYELDGDLADPYVIRDNLSEETDLGRYHYTSDDVLAKFETLEEAKKYCDSLNAEYDSNISRFSVEIVETLVRKVTILAENEEEAMEIVTSNYYEESSGYILDATDYHSTEFYPVKL